MIGVIPCWPHWVPFSFAMQRGQDLVCEEVSKPSVHTHTQTQKVVNRNGMLDLLVRLFIFALSAGLWCTADGGLEAVARL